MKSSLELESRMSLLSRRRRAVRLVSLLLVACLGVALTGTAAGRVVNRKISVGQVEWFQLSPDGRYVVFMAGTRADDTHDLYSVPTAGTAPVKLNPALAEGVTVRTFQISPDSQKVVYQTGPVGYGVTKIYVTKTYAVPIAGGPRVDLVGAVVPGGGIGPFQISPNSQGVVYMSDRVGLGSYDLWAVSMAGGSPVVLNNKHCESCMINGFEIMPNSLGVVYSQTVPDAMDPLVAVSITGDRLTLAYDVIGFHITPDGQRVIYLKFGTEQIELFSVQLSSGSRVRLNDTLVAGGYVRGFAISPNSQRVVYLADANQPNREELFSVPASGGAAVRLNSNLGADGDVIDWDIAPNSLRVVYQADQQVDGRLDLYAVLIGGGTPVKLNGTITPQPPTFLITPNSQGVLFRGYPTAGEGMALYAAGITGSPLVPLSGPMPAGRNVESFRIAPNSQGVVYRADQQTDEIFSIYAVGILGGTPVKLKGPLAWLGDVDYYTITPDSKGVVYMADQETNDIYELFATLDLDLVYLPVVMR